MHYDQRLNFGFFAVKGSIKYAVIADKVGLFYLCPHFMYKAYKKER